VFTKVQAAQQDSQSTDVNSSKQNDCTDT